MKKPWARWRWALGGWLARLRLWQPGKLMYIGGSDVLPAAPEPGGGERSSSQRLAQGDQSASRPASSSTTSAWWCTSPGGSRTRAINIEDLISIGTIGLIKAVGTYQPDKNIKLATYASRCIENEILMHLRKTAGQKSGGLLRRAAEHRLGRQRAAALRRAGDRQRPGDAAHRGGRGPAACWRQALDTAQPPGAADHHPALRPGRRQRSRPRRRWRTGWASPSPTSPGWKSGSSAG